jgi:hypothetical protein
MKENLDLNKMTLSEDQNMKWPEAIRDITFMVCLLIALIHFIK